MFRRCLIAGAVALASAPALAATYTLDPNHTEVLVTWNHFGFSNPSAEFGNIEAKVNFDQADPTRSSVTAKIPIASVNSNVAKLDEHLKSADYFDAAKYPFATFKSTKVERGAAPNKLEVTGDLTIHGVTKPVTLEVTVNKVGEHPLKKEMAAGFDATTTIKRSDFGITRFVPAISDDIKIHVTTEAIEAKAGGAGAKKAAK